MMPSINLPHFPISKFKPHSVTPITMERNFAAVTVFTLLFAVSTARISLDTTPTNNPVVEACDDIKSQPESAAEDSDNILLPTETAKSESDATGHVQQTKNDWMFKVDLTPRPDLAKFHAIKRHFDESRVPRSAHRRPYRHFLNPFVVPRSGISQGNEMILSGGNGNVDAQNLHRQTTMNRMKFKRNSGHHQHRHKYHHHIQHGNNDIPIRKHKSDGEKVKTNLVHQHKEKKLEHEAGFMKSIRKFLKHTFD